MDITLTFDDRKMTANLQRLKTQAPLAISRALNKSIASGKVIMVREMSQDLGLKVSDVREQVKVTEATPNKLEARLTASGKRIPLIAFSATGREPSRGKGKGVSYKLQGQRRTLSKAFLATMSSGHRGVFMRKGKGRLPIRELFGPSLPKVFAKFRPLGLARSEEQLRKNLVSEFRFVMSKA